MTASASGSASILANLSVAACAAVDPSGIDGVSAVALAGGASGSATRASRYRNARRVSITPAFLRWV